MTETPIHSGQTTDHQVAQRTSCASLGHTIEATPAGIFLAAALSTIDVHTLDGSDRVAVLRAHQRLASHYAAKAYEAMGAIADAVADGEGGSYDDAIEGATAEVRVALSLTRRAADVEFAFSHHLRTRLPAVAAMLEEGLIDVRRAKAIDHATSHLSSANAQSVVARLAPAVPHLTTGQIGARIKRMGIEVDPGSAADRYSNSVGFRRLVVEPSVDGTAHLHIFDLPPDRAASIRARIQRMAKSLRTNGEARTMDQLRTDVAVDLLLGKETSSGRSARTGTVAITVDLDTLVGLTEHPGDLNGYGPVISDIARRVVDQNHDASWRFTVTDTETNASLATGRTHRRPEPNLRRYVAERDITCVFPGCRMPAADCDIDHIVAWIDKGATNADNLAPLCRHDHRLKHKYGWRYGKDADGAHRWITALGNTVVKPRDPP